MVARTEGWGEELLRRIMDAGRAKVRAATCKRMTKAMPSQTQKPEAGLGDSELDGKREMYGARK